MNMFFRNSAVRLLAGTALSLSFSAVHAQGFADDFTSSVVNTDFNLYTNALANPDTVATVDDSGLLVNIVHNDPTGDERAAYELYSRRATNSVSSTGIFLGERPTVGNLRYETLGRFYNSIADGGLGPDNRTGEVEIEITLRLGTSSEEDSAEVCFKDRDSEGNSQPLEETRNKCELFQIAGLDVDTPYTLEVGLDRNTQELYGEVNGERISVTSPTPFYVPEDNYAWARFRVRDGAETGSFRLSSLTYDDAPADLNGVATFDRYKTDDYDDFRDDDTRSKEVVDGRLRLSSTITTSGDGNDAFLRFSQSTDYIEADLVYSSESTVDTSAGGFSAVRIAGILYNEISNNQDDEQLGSVWASVMLIDNADTGLVAEYCAIRSDADDFSESTDLADGLANDRCPTFEMAVSPDTVYNASLALDQDAKTITYKLGEEVIVLDITTDVYKRDYQLRTQARISGGATGTVVGYFDNLRSNPTALTDAEILASMNTDSPDTTSGGSGGGCSIVKGHNDSSLLLLLLAASILFYRRQAKRLSK